MFNNRSRLATSRPRGGAEGATARGTLSEWRKERTLRNWSTTVLKSVRLNVFIIINLTSQHLHRYSERFFLIFCVLLSPTTGNSSTPWAIWFFKKVATVYFSKCTFSDNPRQSDVIKVDFPMISEFGLCSKNQRNLLRHIQHLDIMIPALIWRKSCVSPHVRESKTVLDSGLHIMDSGFHS